MKTIVESQALSALQPRSFDAALRPQCLAGTRQDILTQITDWVSTPSATANNILWVHGVAGAGKSTISSTVAEYFRGLRRLGAFLFFDRNDPAGSGPGGVIRTIAYMMATLDAHIRSAVCAAITEDPTIATAHIQTQFQKLLLEPLTSAHTHIPGPIIIILDALDECGNAASRESLVSLIANEFHKLPAVFRFLIASRPNSDIAGRFHEKEHIVPLLLNIRTESTHQDIVAYLRHSMQNVQITYGLERDWPGESVIKDLADDSGGLFIWASTAVKFIEGFDPEKRLATLRGARVGNSLNKLYATALRNSADWGDESFAEAAHLVFGAIVLGMEPLTEKAVDKLLGFKDGQTVKVLRYLGCVIQWGQRKAARILHASFSDYLTDPSRRGRDPWFVDSEMQSKNLALGCLRVLNSQLQFNICHLQDSHVLNADVPGLSDLVRQHIPEELKYASRFWSHHLPNTSFNDEILVELKELISTRFPYWLEVLSLLNQVSVASGSLRVACDYVKGPDSDMKFHSLVQDTLRVMACFAPVIAQSVPHIYISVLPCTPRQSLIFKQFESSFPHTLRCLNGPPGENWSSILKVIHGHGSDVTSVAFSPDGHHIISGSQDCTMRVWDAETGTLVVGPITAYAAKGTGIGVAFSPNGRLIASAGRNPYTSEDAGLCLWDAKTGALVTGPVGDGGMRSVAFSQHGTLLGVWLSGGMRLWDVQLEGGALEELYENDTPRCDLATFSTDCKRIAYAVDGIMGVWDLEQGSRIESIKADFAIRSIAFALDGTRIVSVVSRTEANRDGPYYLKLWDAATVSWIAGFFEEPLLQCYSWQAIPLSTDGSEIISGASENAVHLWDSNTGAVVGRLTGHTSWVTSVAFSPDGRRVVSGAHDRTIRVWDAQIALGRVDQGGHTDKVTWVAFSPEDTHILSGSKDSTVKVWDSTTGVLLTTWNVKGEVVAISPDGKQIACRLDCSPHPELHVWNTDTDVWQTILCDTKHPSLAFSPNGRHIAVGLDKSVKIWTSESGELLSETPAWAGSCVAFSADGLRVAARALDGRIQIWNLQNGGVAIATDAADVSKITFSPDGKKLASWTRDGRIQLLNAESGELLAEHSGFIFAFSPDGTQIAFYGSDDKNATKTIRVCDADTGEVVAGPFQGHAESVRSVHFSHDGRRIVSGSEDTTIRVWELDNGNTSVQNDGGPAPMYRNQFFDDGWITDAHSRRLFWLPPWRRLGLYWPGNSLVIHSGGTTRLDLNEFVHGTDWDKCVDATDAVRGDYLLR